MSLPRQVVLFLIVGGCQLALDWLVFVVLSSSGLSPGVANISGRLAGAFLGFWLNGQITFARPGQTRSGNIQLARFAILWVCATLVSTILMTQLAAYQSLTVAWAIKPVVEAVLAVMSFLVSRHWVYR